MEDLLPDFKRKDVKRKFPSHTQDASGGNKKPTVEGGKSSSDWNNFRIPKLSNRGKNGYNNKSRGGNAASRPFNQGPGRGASSTGLGKPVDK